MSLSFQEPKIKMDKSTDVVANLVHQYLTDTGHKAVAVKLANKLNLDTRASPPDFRLEDMCPTGSKGQTIL